jgi:outer membrane protein assembly factor BamB
MTDHNSAVRLDTFLDNDLSGEFAADPLAATAVSLRELDRSQQERPANGFRAQLGQSLFASSNGVHQLSAADEPVPLVPARPDVPPSPRPRKSHRLLAIAAVLLLLIGGAGAVTRLPIGNQRDSEPSAIPAASFGSPMTSLDSAADDAGGTQAATSDATVSLALANDTLYRFISNDVFTGLVAIRTEDSSERWKVEGASSGELAVDDQAAYVAFDSPDAAAGRVAAYSATDGGSLWTWSAGGAITGLAVADGTVYAVVTDGSLSALDAESGDMRWRTQLDSGAGPDATVWGDRSVQVSGDFVAALSPGGMFAVVNVSDGSVRWRLAHLGAGTATFAVTAKAVIVFEQVGIVTPAAGSVDPATALPRDGAPPDWQSATYDLVLGGSYAARGFQDMSAQPVAIENLVAVAATALDLPATGGRGHTGLFGISSWGAGIVMADLPGAIAGRHIAQLGIWNPPDSAPAQFVVVTEDGVLALIAPKHLGMVDDPTAPDPYDGAIVDFGQPAISAPVGDENGIWIVLADGTLAEIHPSRLNQDLPQDATPEPPSSRIAWQLDPPETGIDFHTVSETLSAGTLYRLLVVNGADGPAHWVQAIDVANGEVRWERRFLNGGYEMVVNGDAVAMITVHRSMTAYSVVVLDANTGDERWQAELAGSPERSGAPVVTMTDTQLLALTADGRLEAFDLGTGEIDLSLPLVNSTDLASSSLKILPIVDPSRFALDGDTLAVVVGDGSVVGVDLANEWIIWRVVPDGIGANSVYAIDGQFVVVAVKGLAASATPGVPTRIPLTTPLTASDCDRFISSGSVSDATPAFQDQADAMELLGIDAQSGDVQWRGWASEPVEATVWTWVGDDTFSMVVSPSSEWPSDGSSAIVCAIDAATGAVSYRGDQANIAMSALTFRSLEDGQFFEVRIFEPGYGFAFSTDVASETGPYVEIDAAADEVSRVTMHGEWVYLMLTDGRLIQVADQA